MTNEYKFYFSHATTLRNLIKIINDGEVKFGHGLKYIDKISEGKKNIYLNINFDDLKNMDSAPRNYILLISPSIITNGLRFNKGWTHFEDYVVIDKNDVNVKDKIKKIHDWIKSPDLPEMISNASFMNHEILINKKINLKKYLIGIISFDFSNKKDMIKVRSALIDNNLDDITIHKTFMPLNTLIL
jgi:hypothetical protein